MRKIKQVNRMDSLLKFFIFYPPINKKYYSILFILKSRKKFNFFIFSQKLAFFDLFLPFFESFFCFFLKKMHF